MTCLHNAISSIFFFCSRNECYIILGFVFYAWICRRANTIRVCIILYVNSTSEETWQSLQLGVGKKYTNISILVSIIGQMSCKISAYRISAKTPISCIPGFNHALQSLSVLSCAHHVSACFVSLLCQKWQEFGMGILFSHVFLWNTVVLWILRQFMMHLFLLVWIPGETPICYFGSGGGAKAWANRKKTPWDKQEIRGEMKEREKREDSSVSRDRRVN